MVFPWQVRVITGNVTGGISGVENAVEDVAVAVVALRVGRVGHNGVGAGEPAYAGSLILTTHLLLLGENR